MRGAESTFQAIAVLDPAMRQTFPQVAGPILVIDCPLDDAETHLTRGDAPGPVGWLFAAGSLGTDRLISLFQISETLSPHTLRVILGPMAQPADLPNGSTGKLLELTDGWIPWPVQQAEFLFRLGIIHRGRANGLPTLFPSPSEKDQLIQRLQGEIADLRLSLNRCFLTGLLNRKGIEEKLAAECARRDRYDSPISLIMVDIDHFKRINDRYLHTGGDEVLRQLGQHFRSQVRAVDAAGRLGGEEFWVVAPGTDLTGASVLARRLCETTREKPFHTGTESIFVSVSIGVAVAERGQPTTPAQLYALSAEALREAKNQGRDGVVIRSVSTA